MEAQAKSGVSFREDPRAVVSNGEGEGLFSLRQAYGEAAGAGVLDSIVHGFLCNAEEVDGCGLVANQNRAAFFGEARAQTGAPTNRFD